MNLKSTDAKRVLIAGYGYVGGALGGRLAGAGWEVFGLRRSGGGAGPGGIVGAGIQLVRGDLVSGAGLGDLPGGLDAVVYCAAADGPGEGAYRDAYVRGVENLLGALGTPPARVIFTSSTGVYAQDGGEWVDEDSPTLPGKFSGRVLLEGEALVRGLAGGVVARLGGIYGPGRSRLIAQVRAGSAYSLAGRTQFLNLIHRDDAAGALAHLLGLGSAAGCYCVVDGQPFERGELLGWIAGELGAPAPAVRDAEEAPDPQRGGNRRVSSARLRASGYVFEYPDAKAGLGAMLREERG